VPGARLKGAAFDAPVINLSKTGLAISTRRELEPGDSYSAWLETNDDRSWIEGRVVWCAPRVSPEKQAAPSYEVGLSVQTIESGAPAVPVSEAAGDRKQGVRSAPRVDVSGMRLRAADLDAEVVNFSSRGLAVRAGTPFETGRGYDAKLETPDGTVFLKAMVVWCSQVRAIDEHGPGIFNAGLELQGVDQRLDPLSDDLVAAQHENGEPESVEWPPAPELQAAEEGATGASEATKEAELAPWLAELTETLRGSETGAAKPLLWRRAAFWVVVLAAVAVISALWLTTRRSADATPTSIETSSSMSASSQAETRPDTTASNALVEELEPVTTVAWDGTEEEAGTESPAATGPVLGNSVTRDQASSDRVEATPRPALLGAILVRANVNVRGGPGLDFPVVRRTGANELLPFVSRQGEWFRLQADQESWMHMVTVLAVQEAARPLAGPAVSGG